MSVTVMQLNIRNWKTSRYIFSCDFCNYSPDVILLNETSSVDNSIKLKGYYVVQSCLEQHSGVVILVRNTIKFNTLVTKDTNTFAIKILTTLGPLIIATCYIPPRLNVIPTFALNKILDYNLPTLLIADFNAHNQMFLNTLAHHYNGDYRGAQLALLARGRNLDFLGPLFNTFKTNRAQGKPDIVLANNQFRMFHHNITKGNQIASDHIPIIIKISSQPIKVIQNRRVNVKSIKTCQVRTLFYFLKD